MAQLYATGQSIDSEEEARPGRIWTLALASLGVAYGDIGTSPLYALREAVQHARKDGLEVPEAVLGVLSLILWALILIVTLKYVTVLLRADNKGEGGTFALMALGQSVATRSASVISVLGVMGASFFYGDAVLTPAISVLSAVEGLKLVAPALEPFVIPVTIVILVALFAVQSRGTGRVASFLAPLCCSGSPCSRLVASFTSSMIRKCFLPSIRITAPGSWPRTA